MVVHQPHWGRPPPWLGEGRLWAGQPFACSSGSNDGSSWTVLDTRSGVTDWSAGTWHPAFTFANSTPYVYHRLNITEANGSIVNIAEIELNGEANTIDPSGEAWVVLKANPSAKYNGLWHIGTNNSTFSSCWPYDATTSRFDTYEGFGLIKPEQAHFTSPVDTTDWRLYRVKVDSTSMQAWVDGTLAFTNSSAPARGFTSNAKLGQNSSGYYFQGDIAEVLLRDKVSTPAEVQELIAYFNSEHGLSVPVE